jgi:uncharacterized protein YwgA
MKRLQRAAVVTVLVDRMREHGSWCGETHVQKAAYILQELRQVDLGYEFVLYKHGPFSFDFRDELGELIADGVMRYEPQQPRYGPRMAVTREAERVREIYPRTLARHDDSIDFVAQWLDARGVVDLERLATALYVTRETPLGTPIGKRAQRLRELKPHVPEQAAVKAVEEIDEMAAAAS